jgi:hypothetical protein
VIIDTVHCTELGCDCPGNRWWTGWIGAVEIHLVPIDDSSPHLSEECACDPSIELHVAGDGYASWRVSHNSLDRRELTEELLPDRSWPPPTL